MHHYVGWMPAILLGIFMAGVATIEPEKRFRICSFAFYALYSVEIAYFVLWSLAWFDPEFLRLQISLDAFVQYPTPWGFVLGSIVLAGLAANFQGGGRLRRYRYWPARQPSCSTRSVSPQ